VPRQGHNTPFPLRRSPPASFKRLLGGKHPETGCQRDTAEQIEPQRCTPPKKACRCEEIAVEEIGRPDRPAGVEAARHSAHVEEGPSTDIDDDESDAEELPHGRILVCRLTDRA